MSPLLMILFSKNNISNTYSMSNNNFNYNILYSFYYNKSMNY